MSSFQPSKVQNMLALMLDPQYKGLGLVIQLLISKKLFILQMKGIIHTLFLCIQDPKPN
jgi:hypothetical protein